MADLWKMFGPNGWSYYEVSQVDRLVADLTEAAIHYEYNRSTAGAVDWKRRRLRAWFMRGREDSLDEERAAGLHKKSFGRPELYALIDGEWIEVEWTLIEPTVDIGLSGDPA